MVVFSTVQSTLKGFWNIILLGLIIPLRPEIEIVSRLHPFSKSTSPLQPWCLISPLQP